MSEKLLGLAEKKFGTLTPSDKRFFKRIGEGRPADFSTRVPEQDNPAGAGEWGSDRVLASDRVMWLCRDSTAFSMISGLGIQIVGARIDGDINLRCVTVPFPLAFKKCALSGNVNLAGSNIHLLDFSGSHVCSIDCTASKVSEGIFFSGGFKADRKVCIEYVTTGGRLDCSGGQFTNVGDDALDADGAKVRGDVLLHNGFKAEGMVSLVGAKIGGNLECNQGVFKNAGKVTLNAERLHVDGDVFLCKGSWPESSNIHAKGFIANGEVKLGRAKIGGTLECTGGLFDNSGSKEPAISAKGLTVTGDVLLHNGFVARGKVDLVGSKIGGNLECKKGVIKNEEGHVALDAEGINVRGDVFLCKESWGEGKHIIAEGFTAAGEVKFVRAVIGGDINCIGGEFCNLARAGGSVSGLGTECSINAKGLKITGSVFMSEGFSAKGKVDLVGASVGGNLEFNSGELLNKGNIALDAERIKVTGDVFLCGGRWHTGKPSEEGHFRIEGNINLIGAKVGGTVKFSGASFEGEPADSITSNVSLLGAIIKRELVWTKIVSPKQVELDLSMARIGRLSDDNDSRLMKRGQLRLDGLVYEQLITQEEGKEKEAPGPHVSALWLRIRPFWGYLAALGKRLVAPFRRQTTEGRVQKDTDARIEWLRLQGNRFRYQPYEQLAAFLRRQGRDAEASTVLIAKAQDRARLTEMAFVTRCWHWFLGLMIGYGYRPWRALVMAFVVVALGTLIFSIGHTSEIIKETKLVEHVVPGDPASANNLDVRKDYPEFNALVYSLDMFVPLVDLRQAAYWLPSAIESNDTDKKSVPIGVRVSIDEAKKPDVRVRLLRLYMWFHILSGWVLTSLLVVGLGGLVKR